MSRVDTLDIIHNAMFDSAAEDKLSEADKVLVTRLKDGYTVWLEKPLFSDKYIRDYLIAKYSISRQQALRDITYIKAILGDVKNASVEFFRYKINNLLDQAANAATHGNYAQAKALSKVAEAMIKNNRTDALIEDKPDFDKVIIPDMSFSINPKHAGVNVSPNAIAKANKLRKQLLGEESEITDYEEID